ncbi:protein VASCULAR ASSOCIATED DEATH 1, chloroplastic isoform X2 [Benincasa hispida]|uniref:protein VASCULAR ASSOCIATED DEATH 1, chloroplastic isoform X2 n=1 Tax=Benincasa hispida TaxID=102211 RepID=UPI0019017885|nr:protein VASCULAR ASSOCIATED DEATH 1, chloroplastic isoform X2 [Benincasa hispida]
MAAAASTAAAEIIELPRPRDKLPVNLSPDSASCYPPESSSSSADRISDTNESSSSPDGFHEDVEIQSSALLRSEEYRQFFRLPSDEVLIEDFNCAFQENILIQGHMYLFVHYICFYSNIFGFETKKIIPLQEITAVRKAKTAGIFPNAIEIFVGEKKYFFASFLSRDEAFNLINDGWLQHAKGTEAIMTKQKSINESSRQEIGILGVEKAKELDPSDSSDSMSTPILNVSMVQANVEEENALPAEPIDAIQESEPILDTHGSTSRKTLTWKPEDTDAPKVPDYYTQVAESKFLIKVEDFFSFYFSDNAVDFVSSYHEKCGDKEFKCSLWRHDDMFGHTRDISFQHPIKIYFGAKYGGCLEIQKFRVYRDSHLVIEVTQEVSEVPYSDYFRVEAHWEVKKDVDDESNNCCILRVYVNVAFSKRTVWKGKIVQSTLEECREAYGMWIQMAKELLKQKLKGSEEGTSGSTSQSGKDHHIEEEINNSKSLEKSNEKNDQRRVTESQYSTDVDQQAENLTQGVDSTSAASWLRVYMKKLWSVLRSQNYLPLALVITFAVIFLMQLSIVLLLSRPQHIHVSSPDYGRGLKFSGGRSSDATAWLEKRMHHLKDEMYMVEARLEMMRREHAQLKAQLTELEELS